MTTTRRAIVTGPAETVARYLPSNYTVNGTDVGEGRVLISGVDNAGWTLDGYVLPRLASGLYGGREVDPGEVSMMVSPEDGDGESWYFEVTRHGETWDDRAETHNDAVVAADNLLHRLIGLQEQTGRNHSGPIR
jgi:hypothetical protein